MKNYRNRCDRCFTSFEGKKIALYCKKCGANICTACAFSSLSMSAMEILEKFLLQQMAKNKFFNEIEVCPLCDHETKQVVRQDSKGKKCSSCGKTLDEECFVAVCSQCRSWFCPSCGLSKTRYQHVQEEAEKEQRWSKALEANHGIHLGSIVELFSKQGGCPVCIRKNVFFR